ncbi:hypothetical protein DBR32_03770 [Taibaiella sp. KBW10]|uniref:glycosyltransferase family 2 protein n=1 Tax=Taibaiella sp. KBW10 TaxID=2153357 RepID=UPI000F598CA6|nr:glycosyltransferase family 2 protein [Taibaiella sp. KBW10]RQO31934.1 hypothetical protein DBR32_03770 [Taibaiella sp. KBW10]
MKQLTIVIAYYNIQYFEQTLISLRNQSCKDFKVFVGNDKSPNDPQGIIEAYQEQLDLQYIHFGENLGGRDLTLQWKRCLQYVNTEWFMILGDDDMLSADAVEGFYKAIKTPEPQAKVLRYGIQIIDGEGVAQTDIIRYEDMEPATEFIYKRAKNAVRSSLGEYIFRLKDYKVNGITSYPKAFYSDNMMVLENAHFGPVKNVPFGHALIRISENSFSGNDANKKELTRSGYLFYTDLLVKYAVHFKTLHKDEFLDYVLAGYLTESNNLKLSQIIKLVFKNASFKKCIIIFLRLLKRKLTAGNRS